MSQNDLQHADPSRENLDGCGEFFLPAGEVFDPRSGLGGNSGDGRNLPCRALNFTLRATPKREAPEHEEGERRDDQRRSDNSRDEYLVFSNPVHLLSMPAPLSNIRAVEPSFLPTVSEEAHFVDHLEVGARPHVVVDGPPGPGTVLALSHWPQARIPPSLSADSSTGIVARYLDAAATGPAVEIVTNNHYDEDGTLAIWLLLNRCGPDDPRRELAIAAAEAGDFRTWTDPAALQVSIALMRFAERATTPFPGVLRALSDQSGRNPAGAVISAVLPRVGSLLSDPDRYQRFWGPSWDHLQPDLGLVDGGEVRIEEDVSLDLAIVRAPRAIDSLALYRRLTGNRVVTLLAGGEAWLTYRYESWVTYASRWVAPRVDLTDLADRLQGFETGSAVWRFEGVEAITPRLAPFGSRGIVATEIDHDRLVHEFRVALRTAHCTDQR